MTDQTRRASLFAGLAIGFLIPALAHAESPVTLFRIVSPKDEVVVATSLPLDEFARRLKAEGQMVVWQYAVRKAGDGSLQQAPLRRVSVFSQDIYRIEPYATPLIVLPPPS